MRYETLNGLKVGDRVVYTHKPKNGPDFAQSIGKELVKGQEYIIKEIGYAMESDYITVNNPKYSRNWWIHISQFSSPKKTNAEKIKEREAAHAE
jgi:hypothetical protein